jgi:collagenase-like PrtC family protease
MKITSCFLKLAEIEPLPSFCDGALPGIKSLKAAVKRTHALGKTLSVAVNSLAHVYPASRPGRLLGLLREIDACGVDAFIAANPFLPPLSGKLEVPLKAGVHLSSVQPCFNSMAARFFIGRGISRLILPTQVSPFEAAGIVKACQAAGVETEIFDYRFCGCTYINGRCDLHNPVFHTLSRNAGGSAACRYGAPLAIKTHGGPAAAAEIAALQGSLAAGINRPQLPNDAAAFFDFFLAGVGFLKYGARLDPTELKIRKVTELRVMADLAGKLCGDLGKNKARKIFLERMAAWRGRGGCRL